MLHALNPLQYLPVVGTIYRAVTGDRIPEGLEMVGSLAVGAAISGPIGLVTGIAAIIAEKATGIDPDKLAHRVAVGLGIVHDAPPPTMIATSPAQSDVPKTVPKAADGPPPDIMNGHQMPGRQQDEQLSDAEALNARELDRIHAAVIAYSRTAALG